jgi:DNA transformation protein and related proteins
MDSFKDFVADQLRDLPGVKCRSMFGGYGIYSGDAFFGIIYEGALYLKTSKETLPEYLEEEMKPFQPSRKQTLKAFYEVPSGILEDREVLMEWVEKAVSAALAKPRKR